MKFLKAFIREFAIPIAIALVVIAFAIQAFKIPSGSMEDTLFEGDFLLGLKFVYGVPIPFSNGKIPVSEPDTGEIVIFRYPGEPEYPDYDNKRYTHLANALMFGNFFWDSQAPSGSPKLIHYADGPKDYIKRCVAKSGQRIAVKEGKLFLDGVEKKVGGLGKYTEKSRGSSPRDNLKEIRLPEPDETISFDTLSTRDLWWIRSLMVQEMPDSLVEFGISLTQNGLEQQDYVFEDFQVPIENHKYLLINEIFRQNHVTPQGLKIGDTINGKMSLSFFRKFARTGFLMRHNPNVLQKSLFGSRLVGYDAFDGSQLEDLEANVEFENSRLAANADSLDEPAKLELKWQILVNGKPVSEYKIKDKVYFMMGDNRDNSADSRYWGFVSTRNIKAKAFIVYFSLEKESDVELLKPWTWIYLPADIRWGRIARIIHLI
ncbi:MAG: signal peptidase I [Candidatus Fibromonas sp.]|jgi:signal peptidase I|nr:signal peptidase I [Candidatus Fibromonas sp.]